MVNETMMNRTILSLAIIAYGVSLFCSAAPAADSARGKALFDENCTDCHGIEKFTRKDRHVRSLKKLKTQVWNCQDGAGYDWTQEQIDDVVEYLNAAFYHFK